MKRFLQLLISLYKRTTPFRTPSCRFYPSCSTYFYQALEEHGVIYGSCLGLYRLLRCQPLSAGGVDEVPSRDCNLHDFQPINIFVKRPSSHRG
jgi:putative membrane protein insertion efficiency factor